MDKNFIKRRYTESRIGSVTLNPIMATSNFIMLIWITIQTDVIPFWLFIPLMLIALISLVTFVGYKFRTIQLSTDEDIKYEKQADFNRTLYHIMSALDNDMQNKSFYDRMDYVKKLGYDKTEL